MSGLPAIVQQSWLHPAAFIYKPQGSDAKQVQEAKGVAQAADSFVKIHKWGDFKQAEF